MRPPDYVSPDGRHRAWSGDALLELRGLTAEALGEEISAVIIDPPYCSGGLSATERKRSVQGKYGIVGGFEGDWRDQRAFGQWLALLLAIAYRSTAEGGRCWVWTDWRQLPTMSDALQAAGWVWVGLTPWVKAPGKYRNTKGSAGAQCEYLLWGSKGRPWSTRADVDAPALPGVLTGDVPRGEQKRHGAEKPVSALASIMRLLPPDALVLDFFAGSGSTAEAAGIAGHRSISIEVDPAVVEGVFVSRFDGRLFAD